MLAAIEPLESRLFLYAAVARWNYTSAGGSSGYDGHYATISYSIAPDGTQIDAGQGEKTGGSVLRAKLNADYGGESTWLPLINAALTVWSKAAGPEFIYEPHDDGAAFHYNVGLVGTRGDVRIGAHPIDGVGGTLGYTWFPASGEIILDSDDMAAGGYLANKAEFIAVIEHESGHGIGLDHSAVAGSIMNPVIAARPDASGVTPLGSDDVAGARYLYGAAPIPGDANRDGKIDISDYGAIDFALPLGWRGFANGDFNYDGKIDISDYGIIDFAIAHQM